MKRWFQGVDLQAEMQTRTFASKLRYAPVDSEDYEVYMGKLCAMFEEQQRRKEAGCGNANGGNATTQ